MKYNVLTSPLTSDTQPPPPIHPMQPIITASGKLAQLRYELPHRVHDAKIYPVKAPNGSTIILYGHETGVGILWRGGRPLKKAAASKQKQAPRPAPKVNGNSSDAIMIIESDDDEPAKSAPLPPPAEFELEEDELDPDQPYPSIVQQVRLSLSTEVLHIALPQIPTVSALRPAETVPAMFNQKMVFTVACADYSVRVITLPLSPPSDAAKDAPPGAKSPFGEEVVKVPTHAGHQSIPRGVSMTWTSRAAPTKDDMSEDEMQVDGGEDATPGRQKARRKQSRSRSGRRSASEGWDLLVASHSDELGGLLKLWRFALDDASLTVKSPISAYQTLNLRTLSSRIAFNSALYPKRRHSQLLITHRSGIARVYDPFARPARATLSAGELEPGAFVALFTTTFQRPRATIPIPASLVTRKPLIDAAWASDGHCIFALLADGEWGIWDVDRTGPNPPADPSAFSARGYIGPSESNRAATSVSSPKRSNRGSLVPMTPNTRKTKEETLFKEPSSSSMVPTRGGVSVASLPSTTGGPLEDSILVWYGSDAYRIPNLGQFWTKTASGNTGALSGSGLTKIPGLALYGEAITSVDQFGTTTQEARMAIPRDSLISTEHRLIITTNAVQPVGRDLNGVFAGEQAEEKEARKNDLALLTSGELDLGGMDRLLENLEGSGSGQRSLMLGGPRKVLFASSTS
jgi:hypothetical protein